MWMGWVTCTDKNGDITKVDKSWGYKRTRQARFALFCIIRRCPINQVSFGLTSAPLQIFGESVSCFQMRILPSVRHQRLSSIEVRPTT